MIYARNFCKTIQKMKIIKIILLFASIVFFTSIPLKAKAGHGDGVSIDCATAVKLHEKAWCKMKGKDTPSSTAKKEKPKKKKVKEKSTEVKKKIEGDMKSLWKKIKNFGGKNIGEEG